MPRVQKHQFEKYKTVHYQYFHYVMVLVLVLAALKKKILKNTA